MKLLIALLVSMIASLSCIAQTLTGTVTDDQNAAVANAGISVSSNGAQLLQTRSDGAGQFSLTFVDRPNLVLRVDAEGFSAFEIPINKLSSPLIVVLRPTQLREHVTVSITKTESRLNETPASVVVLDRQTLDSSAAQAIDDALRQIAGFTLFRRSSSKTANPTTQGANLRGVGGSGAARTSVNFDGVSLNDAFGGWTYWSRVPQIAVDQAEVLRGGASSLYGGPALSGAINLNPYGTNEKALRIQTSGGSQSTFDGSVYAAYSKSGWHFDLAGESFQTVGYIPTAPEQRGLVDTHANSRHNSGFFTLERRFNESARAFVRGTLFSERRDNGTSLTNNRTYFRQIVFGADHSTAKLGSFQFRTALDSQVYDQTFSAVSSDRNSESITRVQRVPSRSAWASLFWTRAIGDHTISAQADVRGVHGFSDETAIANNRATALITSGGEEFTVGVFAQDFWRITSRLNLSFSGRFDHWNEFDGLSRTQSLVTGDATIINFPGRSEHRFSPRIAALYQVTNAVSVYGSYSGSFRAPSLNELYRAFRVGNVLTLANENLTAENADTFEAGASVTAFSKRVAIRGNVFHTTVSDPVVSVTLASTPTLITRQRQNLGATRARGFEIDGEFAITEKVRLTASYLLSDSRVTESPGNEALVGNQVPQVARHQFTAQVVYKPLSRFTTSLQARASDAQFDDDLNTFRLRPYFTLDAYAGYRFKKWLELFVAVENIFDQRYDIGLTPIRTIAAPRFIRTGLRFDLFREN